VGAATLQREIDPLFRAHETGAGALREAPPRAPGPLRQGRKELAQQDWKHHIQGAGVVKTPTDSAA
jgi:hypothetical protein